MEIVIHFMYSPYSLILLFSCSSGTMECRYHPNAASTQFQHPAPNVVYKMNFQKFIFASPAGIEINCLITGSIRPVSVATAP